MKTVLFVLGATTLALVARYPNNYMWLFETNYKLNWPSCTLERVDGALRDGQDVLIFVAPPWDIGTRGRMAVLCEKDIQSGIQQGNVACFVIDDDWRLPNTRSLLEGLQYHALRGGYVLIDRNQSRLDAVRVCDESPDLLRDAVLAFLGRTPARH
jgi:hypothetical protein